MPGFLGGLAHVAAVGGTAYADQQDEEQRKLLAQAQLRRSQRLADRKAELDEIEALTKARESGMTISPSGGSRSGDTPPTTNSAGPSITPEAGPAAKAPPTRIGTIAGMDVTVPEKYEPKAVRDKRAAIDAGVEKPPEQTLHGRIIELRGSGMKPEDAIKQARQEFGMEDPTLQHQKNRLFDVRNPTRSGSSSGATPERRAQYVLRRASQLQKPTRGKFNLMQPGMPRAQAEQMAGEEYDRVHNVEGGGDSSAAAPSSQAGDINLGTSKTAQPTAGAGGAGDAAPKQKTVSPADRAKAAVDPAFRAWLTRKGYKL